VSRGLEQHADSNPASKFVDVGSATGANDRYAVGALDSGVEFLREIGRHTESRPGIDATLTNLVHRPREQVPGQSHIHASGRSLLAFRFRH
jgi:hypothetical protein